MKIDNDAEHEGSTAFTTGSSLNRGPMECSEDTSRHESNDVADEAPHKQMDNENTDDMSHHPSVDNRLPSVNCVPDALSEGIEATGSSEVVAVSELNQVSHENIVVAFTECHDVTLLPCPVTNGESPLPSESAPGCDENIDGIGRSNIRRVRLRFYHRSDSFMAPHFVPLASGRASNTCSNPIDTYTFDSSLSTPSFLGLSGACFVLFWPASSAFGP
jgi:hypothetical protein